MSGRSAAAAAIGRGFLGALLLNACAGGMGPSTAAARESNLPPRRASLARSPIEHVVIVIQENRSVDNLFASLPGANTQSYGYNLHGKRIPLLPQALTGPTSPGHTHPRWVAQYDGGGMNGWYPAEFAYVPPSDVAPYYTMAESYAFADQLFQTNEGPSFPAHQYLVSGTSTISDGSNLRASENPRTPSGGPTGGCDSPTGSLVTLIDANGTEGGTVYPCFERTSLMTELDAAGISWRYYQEYSGAGFWKAVDALEPVWQNAQLFRSDVEHPSAQILTDIAAGQLASVVWVTPSAAASDHAGVTDGSGPSWVASIVNAIGNSNYWNSTAIFVVWDDWGGWFDHVAPPIYNSYELGFRVPLLVVSPYAKPGYVSHAQHEFGSLLKFTEETFGLPSLGTTDQRSDDLSDCFDFGSPSRRFRPVKTKYSAAYFESRPISHQNPDDDR